jgi:hypothetical protein
VVILGRLGKDGDLSLGTSSVTGRLGGGEYGLIVVVRGEGIG